MALPASAEDDAAEWRVALPGLAGGDAAEWRVALPGLAGGDAAGAPAETALCLYRDEIARANEVLAATPLDATPRRRFDRWPDWQVRDVR